MAVITYAQNFEDVMLARLFGGRAEGFYVDVGAGDPTRSSVTKWFYDQGWSGINIEPNKDLFRKLVAARPRDINLDCGVGERSGMAEFAEMSFGERSSFDPGVRSAAVASGLQSTVRMAKVKTLNEVLFEYALGTKIDFLKIDVEGWELQVLLGLDLHRFRPTVLVIEATQPGTPVENSFAWENLLPPAGYSCVWFDGLNRFYLAAERAELRTKFAVPPNFFDDFLDWRVVESREAYVSLHAEVTRMQAEVTEYRRALTWVAIELSAATDGTAAKKQVPELTESLLALQAVANAADILRSRSKTAKQFFNLMSRKAKPQGLSG